MKNIFKILSLARPLQKWIILICVLVTLQALVMQATPLTLKYVVDELSRQISGGDGDYGRLIMLFAFILGFNLILVILKTLSDRLGDFITSRLSRHLTESYYKKILVLPQKYFESELSGKIVSQLSRGIASIAEFINGATNWITPGILQAIFGIGVLAYFDWTVALLATAIFPIYIAITRYSTKRWGKIQEEKNVHEDATRGRISEVVGNIKLVKTYNTQTMEWEYVSDKYQTINRLYDRQSNQYHLLNFIREFSLETIIIIILFVIFRQTFLATFTLGEMVLVISLMNQLRWPLYGMSYILEQVQKADADSKAFFDVLDLKEAEPELVSQKLELNKEPEISFEHVSFSYDDGQPVLSDVTLKFSKHETVALVGHSGAGKTTLVNMILKLYEPKSGRILLSGKDYATLDHSWVRAHSALVFQDSELFSSTVRENVRYGMPDARDEDVIRVLKEANAYEFVSKFKDGLDAEIGERGVKLSGGQKQRIQIARAILHDKPILILDEATSSLDSRSEHLVQDALEKLFKNRLVIIIAHRFSTIQNVNRVVVLDKGTITESGAPADLAEKPGLYSELLSYQVEGNKKLLKQYELR